MRLSLYWAGIAAVVCPFPVSNRLVTLLSLVRLIARDGSGGETTDADPAVGEVEPEEAFGVAESLRGRDGIAQVLDDVEHLRLLGSACGLHGFGELLAALVLTVLLRLVCLAQKQLALAVRRLVQLDERHDNRKPDADEPALGCAARHRLEVEASQKLHFDQHAQVVEHPVPKESESRQNLQVLLELGQLAVHDCLDLYVLVERLEQAEKLPGRAHISCNK